jgi:hypothetical protein
MNAVGREVGRADLRPAVLVNAVLRWIETFKLRLRRQAVDVHRFFEAAVDRRAVVVDPQRDVSGYLVIILGVTSLERLLVELKKWEERQLA